MLIGQLWRNVREVSDNEEYCARAAVCALGTPDLPSHIRKTFEDSLRNCGFERAQPVNIWYCILDARTSTRGVASNQHCLPEPGQHCIIWDPKAGRIRVAYYDIGPWFYMGGDPQNRIRAIWWMPAPSEPIND